MSLYSVAGLGACSNGSRSMYNLLGLRCHILRTGRVYKVHGLSASLTIWNLMISGIMIDLGLAAVELALGLGLGFLVSFVGFEGLDLPLEICTPYISFC